MWTLAADVEPPEGLAGEVTLGALIGTCVIVAVAAAVVGLARGRRGVSPVFVGAGALVVGIVAMAGCMLLVGYVDWEINMRWVDWHVAHRVVTDRWEGDGFIAYDFKPLPVDCIVSLRRYDFDPEWPVVGLVALIGAAPAGLAGFGAAVWGRRRARREASACVAS